MELAYPKVACGGFTVIVMQNYPYFCLDNLSSSVAASYCTADCCSDERLISSFNTLYT